MKEYFALQAWFWHRPLFRNLRPRLMVRLLALALSLIGIVSSGISIYQSVETAYTV